jgi:hypothetical protein
MVTTFELLKSTFESYKQQVNIPIGSAQFLFDINDQRTTRQITAMKAMPSG